MTAIEPAWAVGDPPPPATLDAFGEAATEGVGVGEFEPPPPPCSANAPTAPTTARSATPTTPYIKPRRFPPLAPAGLGATTVGRWLRLTKPARDPSARSAATWNWMVRTFGAGLRSWRT